ncbi:MAG: phosphoglycerate kinase [Defluviicoccus sp.]|nr:phosphoglycerate kinase [Defluviicoccus sp.]MDE0383140.1 phosphoglycerate kinase [Defluviicoccus sp.]
MPRSLDGLALAGKRVLLRGDLNVPMKDGAVADTARLDRLAPTVEEICASGASVVLLSHFGRPGGKRMAALSLAALAEPLSRALGGRRVAFVDDCIGPLAEEAAAALGPGEVLLLENLRFHPGEEANDPGFAAALAALGDVYVNDAFSAAHRAHASTVALARLLPAAAGRSMEAELAALEEALTAPDRPLAAIVGGAKISTKLDLLGNLAGKVDTLVIGGAMANTFLHALGTDVGASLCEPGMAGAARAILASADDAGCEIGLPSDVVIARALEAGAPAEAVPVAAVPGDAMILDLGPATANALAARLGECRTLVWNGPLGAFEVPPFDAATVAVARQAAALTKAGSLRSVAGGGDTVAALSHAGVAEDFSYLSTAGGAFLEWLEGKTLPGVAALDG